MRDGYLRLLKRLNFLVIVLAVTGFLPPCAQSQPPNREVITRAQRIMFNEGHYSGQVDGGLGPVTESAIKNYQRAHQLPETGQLDDDTQRAMGILPASRPTVSGAGSTPTPAVQGTNSHPINLNVELPYEAFLLAVVIIVMVQMITTGGLMIFSHLRLSSIDRSLTERIASLEDLVKPKLEKVEQKTTTELSISDSSLEPIVQSIAAPRHISVSFSDDILKLISILEKGALQLTTQATEQPADVSAATQDPQTPSAELDASDISRTNDAGQSPIAEAQSDESQQSSESQPSLAESDNSQVTDELEGTTEPSSGKNLTAEEAPMLAEGGANQEASVKHDLSGESSNAIEQAPAGDNFADAASDSASNTGDQPPQLEAASRVMSPIIKSYNEALASHAKESSLEDKFSDLDVTKVSSVSNEVSDRLLLKQSDVGRLVSLERKAPTNASIFCFPVLIILFHRHR